MKQLEIAVWCPWAQVLCVACHDHSSKRTRGRILEPRLLKAPFENQGYGRAWCDQCGKGLVAPVELAELQQLQRKFGGELQQMGGGVPALAFREGRHYVLVTNVDDFVIAAYEPNDLNLESPLDERRLKDPSQRERERAVAEVLRQ
jgi:hypothetical protein